MPISFTEYVKGMQRSEVVATPDDQHRIETTLAKHFGGLTIMPLIKGYGLRDPRNAETIELNTNQVYEILAMDHAGCANYFARIRKELQRALKEGVVLVQRDEVMLI